MKLLDLLGLFFVSALLAYPLALRAEVPYLLKLFTLYGTAVLVRLVLVALGLFK